MMESFADLVARHALLILLGMVAMVLVMMALFWHLLNRYAPWARQAAAAMGDAMARAGIAERLSNLPALGPPMSRTLTAMRDLGLYAVTAFALAALSFYVFFELADEIGIDDSMAGFDVALSAALRTHVSGGTLQFFSVITRLGDPEFLLLLGAVVAIVLLARRRWMLALAWIVAEVSGGLLNALLKLIFQRQRPIHDHGLIVETGWSFPSGHASGSVLLYGLLGYLIVRHTRSVWHLPVAIVVAALIGFVGSSRVMLQVHYVSDVLAGYALGMAWIALCIAGLEVARARDPAAWSRQGGIVARTRRSE